MEMVGQGPDEIQFAWSMTGVIPVDQHPAGVVQYDVLLMGVGVDQAVSEREPGRLERFDQVAGSVMEPVEVRVAQ